MYRQTSSHLVSPAVQPREIAFIDSALDDRALLAAAMRPGMAVIEFGGGQDGLAQLALWADGQADYDAIHVLCHGEPGRLILGGHALDLAGLGRPQAVSALAALGAALTPGGALLLYGCSVGAGDIGRRFVSALAHATGAAVAASEVPTGAAARGGDWALPVRTGTVSVPLAVDVDGAAGWPHLMAGVNFDLSTGTRDENNDLAGPVTETIGGLTMSATATPLPGQLDNDAYIWDTIQYGDFMPSGTWSYVAPSNNSAMLISQMGYTASVTVTFSQALALNSLDFADGTDFYGAKLRITATNTGDTTVVDVPAQSDYHVTLNWVGVTGFTITNELGSTLDPLIMDNIVVTPGAVPTTTVATAALSADTGASSTDFVTKTAAQTISGTLSGLLAGGEAVQVSYDNGAHWQNAGTYTVGSNTWSTTTTLAGSGTMQVRVTNAYGGSTAYTHTYTLDTTAPNAPSAPDLGSASDSGASNSDNITANVTPAITGTAESGSTVTLYDTDGTTVLGTATATGGSWSIPTSTLGQGSHTLTAKATDLAGNVSSASSGLAVTIDTTAPTSLALSASSLVAANAGSGATVGTLSATDATAVTYAFAVGNGTNDGDNGQFAVSGTTLSVGGSALTAGTYHVYLSATDAAGNVGYLAQTITVQSVPAVSSIVRAGGAGAGVAGAAASVDYTVTFSESVTGVDASDFALTATGTASGAITAVSGSGTTYTVTVGSLAGDGTLRLDLNASGTGIQNGSSVAIGGGYTAGSTYTLDHTAPNAPSTPDLSGGSDSGASNSDDITTSVTPIITGTAEAGSTVTLYDSDGTTVLGTTTATGGNWSITAGTLAEGGHTLTAKATDAAGNASNASGALAVTIDTTAPSGVALSASAVATSSAGSGATVGSLSASDATAVTYALATGNGTNDADNGQFAVSGTTLGVGSSALTAGTYHVYLSATDAAGNVSHLAQNVTVVDAPTVSSIVRAGGAGTGVAGSATSVDYTVTFSESVTGVDASDFALTATGTASGAITAVSGSGTTYTVTVDSLTGDGTLRLDLNASGTGIQNGGSIAIGGGYTAGATYTLDHTAPNVPSTPDMSGGSDSGASNSDDITSSVTPVITGTAEAGSTVTLYDSDGMTVLGTTTATGGNWSITAGTLAEGSHTLTAKATDSAGNVSNASGALAVTIDTTAPASVVLSGSSLVTSSAGSGATVGSLSASDATAVTYALATGNGSNDADNAKFALSGNTVSVGGSALTAATYHVFLSATDAAGNVSYLAQDITVQDAPTVSSIVRVGGADAGAATSVDYTVTFSESVTGVDASDFALTGTGTAAGTIAAVSGSGTTYTVTVGSLTGDGTLRLDLNASGTGIQNGGSIAIGGGYTGGATYTLDHTAPNAPSTPDMSSGSDSGSSNSDDITTSVTPVITGTAEAGSTVTLYDTNGTTVLGTTTATGGVWSITASTLADGNHSLTAKAADAAGNVSNASSPLALTVDTTAPSSVALSASSLVTANAGSGASVGTLSATDATAVTYALAAGNGSNDADNAQFALSGNTLSVGGTALTAGTYHVYLSATDAAGNVSHIAQNINVVDAPTVSSIVRVSAGDAGAATSVDYTVTFSESVTGVDTGDFALTATGTAAGHIAAIAGSGTTYTVTVDSLAGDGTLRLDLNASGTGIQNGSSVGIGGGYTAGATYTLDHTAPNAPTTPDMSSASDGGSSNSDDITATVTPVITGTAESGSTVTLYDTNGTTVLGTTTAAGGNWSITAGTLAEGSHTLTAKATDAAGNVSNASSPLAVTIDTTAPASLALSAASLVTATAGSGATVGTLSANDATAVTYALASGSNDADNAKFVLSGNTLTVGGSALTAGTYHVYLSATDAAGNVSYLAQDINVQDVPTVSSIVRVGGADAGAATSVDYTVTFSESVTGVDASDFALTATGTAAGHIAAVSGSGTTYTVTVDSLAGDGTLRLDLNASGTGIQNGGSIAIGGGYTGGATYTLDHTAPNAPSTPDMSSASDSGSSSTDDITATVTPAITGTAESGSTVTLYDTNGTTVLGTATAANGTWSITTSTLAEGSHTLTAKAADAAGNVSNASGPLAVTIDTTAPASVALSAASLVTANAGSGATVGTLSANDATAVSYALASGSNDADNAKFALSGNTLTVGGSALTAGTYHVYLSATDAAGNVSHIARNITVVDAPSVTSIVRVGGADAGAATSVDYTVTFSDSVTGVDASDFALTASGTAAGHIAAVSGSGATYTVTVDSLTGDGTLRLDLNASGTGIRNGGSIAIGSGYTTGATYTLDHTAPNAPSTPDMSSASDSGSASTDNLTATVTPVFTGTAEAGSTVTLYDTNGTTVLGTTTATGGVWSITASTLADGSHTLTAKATDAAGNVSNASGPLTITIDTAAAAPGAIALAAASDSGVAGDGITSVNAPAITGTAEANATVTLYDTDGTTQLGATTTDGAGAWQIVSAALADGVHTLTARQVDRAGSVSAASAGLTVAIDTQAPAAPGAPVVDAASDTGTVGDGITTVTRPVIRGTGAANAAVTLYDTDGATLGTATADGAGNWSVTSAALAVGTHALTAKQVDAAGNVSAAGAALALTIAAPPPPPPPAASTIDGVAVSAQPVVLPDGATGTQTVVPIVTPSRVESTGAAAVADIPLVQSGGANLLLAQVPVGFGLSATGGASRPAGDPLEHLIQAIVAATPDHAPADQAHLTGNGKQFLQALAADAPLLVQTVAPVSTGTAPAGQLVLTGTSDGAQHTALVIDATGLAAGSRIALNSVEFAAVVGAANVTGHSAGQILTGDAAAQTFTVAGNLGGAVFAGGGGDRLAFVATPATPSSAGGGVRADAGPVKTILHGGLGTDTAVFDGARSAYTIEQHEGYLVVTPTGQPAQHAVVVNVESLQFADTMEAVDNRAGLSSVAGLYEAILGRQADYLGMDFWGTADRNGTGLGEVALRMIASQEAQGRLSGAFDGNAAHDVALLYQDLFGRAGEAAGLAFWTDAMAHGMTLAQVAQAFATSAEFEQHKVGVAQWDFFV